MARKKKRRATFPVPDGEVFYPINDNARHAHRRVVGVVAGRVFYSTGGNHNHSCEISQFRRSVMANEKKK